MTITVANTEITNTFDYWRSRTNEIAHALTNKVVSADSNATVGTVQITGTLFGNTVSGNTLTITGAATANSLTTNTVIASNVVTSNLVTTTIAINGTTVNSSYYTGTAANANTLGGQAPSYYLNTSTSFANAASQDVVISGAYNTLVANLKTTGVTADTYGNSTFYPTFTVDSKGRLTVAGVQSVNTSTSSLTVNNALFLEGSNTQFFTNATNITTGTLSNARLSSAVLNSTSTFANSAAQDATIGGTYNALTVTLSTTGVTAATYGNTTSIPAITVDAKGRISSIVNTTITTTPNATYVQNTDSRTLSGNLNFTGVNTFFSTGVYLGGATTLNIGTLSVSNTSGNLDLNGAGITDFRGQRQAKTASYTLANTDTGTIIELTTTGTTAANTFTLPSNAPDGFNCTLVQYGTTTLQIQAGSGSTLQKRTSIGANSTIANTGGQYAMATVYCRGSSVWVLGGDVI